MSRHAVVTDKSFEFGEHRGLDIIPGEAVKIDQITKNKVKYLT